MSAERRKSGKRDGAATRASILREALRLFARKGYDATSVKDIASAVGVADAALYRHFPGKHDIASAVFRQHYGALAQSIAAIADQHDATADVLRQLVRLLCELHDSEPEAFAFILIHQHDHLKFIDGDGNIVEELAAIMRAGHARGDIPEPNADLAAAIALGIAVQTAIFHLYGRLAGALKDYEPQITQAIFNALGVSPERNGRAPAP